MTKAQSLTMAYFNAAEIFDNDIKALAVALGGMLKKAGRKGDIEIVLRELNESRLEKLGHFFSKIDDMSQEEIEKCKAYAQCRFSQDLGRMEEIEKLSEHGDMIPPRLAQQEIANIEAMQKSLDIIKYNLKNRIVGVVPHKMNDIRQGSLFQCK